jgi:hypothetical protein
MKKTYHVFGMRPDCDIVLAGSEVSATAEKTTLLLTSTINVLWKAAKISKTFDTFGYFPSFIIDATALTDTPADAIS